MPSSADVPDDASPFATSRPNPTAHRPVVAILSRRGRDSLTSEHQQRLEAQAELRAHPSDLPPSQEQARVLLADADVLAATNACLPVLDDALLSRLPRLRAVVLFATGHDAIDPQILRRHGVSLVVVPDYATVSVAEHALALLLSLTARVHLAQDRSAGRVAPEVSLRGVEVAGRTAAVIGMGRIGRHVAGLLSALGARVIGCDPDPQAWAATTGVEPVDLPTALGRADLVVLAASREFAAPPLLDRAHLALIPAHAFLVNVARLELVDTTAVLEALGAHQLRGYALDDALGTLDNPAVSELIRTGRLLQSGHRAWWTDEALHRGAVLWGERVIAAAQGELIDVVVLPGDSRSAEDEFVAPTALAPARAKVR